MKPLGGHPGDRMDGARIRGEPHKVAACTTGLHAGTVLREPPSWQNTVHPGGGGNSLSESSVRPPEGSLRGAGWGVLEDHLCALGQGQALGGSPLVQPLVPPPGLLSLAGSLTLLAFLPDLRRLVRWTSLPHQSLEFLTFLSQDKGHADSSR